MNFKDAQLAIYNRLDTAMTASYADTSVEYQNRVSVDLSIQTGMFVRAQVVYNDGEQVALGAGSPVRYMGAVYLAVYCKVGEGTAPALDLLGFLANTFKMAIFGGVKTKAPRPLPPREEAGWHVETLRVPFWFQDS